MPECVTVPGLQRITKSAALRPGHGRPAYPANPLTSATTISPITAEPMPIARKVVSGVSSTLIIARFAEAGNAAKIRPSMTKTSPSAARKSDMPAALFAYLAVPDVPAGAGGAAAGAAGAAGGVAAPPRSLPDGSLK